MPDSSDIVSPEAVISTIFIGLANARMRGDPWQALAEEHLEDLERLLKRSSKSTVEALKLFAAMADKVDVIEKCLMISFEKLVEELWVLRGSKHQDSLLSVLTPGTPSFFFEWPIGQSYDRVEAMLEFLEPYMPTEGPGYEAVIEVQRLFSEYRALSEQMRGLRAKIDIFEKVKETFARFGHVQYSRLRRRMKADGFTPDEIRTVFPDIPGKKLSLTLS